MKTFTLRLTDEEAQAVEILATVMRLSKNSFIRGCIHQDINLVCDCVGQYRPKANDLLKNNLDLFEKILYDEIDVLNENYAELDALREKLNSEL